MICPPIYPNNFLRSKNGTSQAPTLFDLHWQYIDAKGPFSITKWVGAAWEQDHVHSHIYTPTHSTAHYFAVLDWQTVAARFRWWYTVSVDSHAAQSVIIIRRWRKCYWFQSRWCCRRLPRSLMAVQHRECPSRKLVCLATEYWSQWELYCRQSFLECCNWINKGWIGFRACCRRLPRSLMAVQHRECRPRKSVCSATEYWSQWELHCRRRCHGCCTHHRRKCVCSTTEAVNEDNRCTEVKN